MMRRRSASTSGWFLRSVKRSAVLSRISQHCCVAAQGYGGTDALQHFREEIGNLLAFFGFGDRLLFIRFGF